KRYGVDGVMIGRASIGYPWIFREIKHYIKTSELLAPPIMMERIHAAKRHLEMSIKRKGEKLRIMKMRRHYSNYFRGIPDFKEMRIRLVTEDRAEELLTTFEEIKGRFAHMQFA